MIVVANLWCVDSKILPDPINQILQRVQDNADFMPAAQRNQVLSSNLGSDWHNLFSSFDDQPIAAASIGQVHKAVLKENGQSVAVKIQYPGVANSISSDLSNLSLLLTASRLLPKGLFLDKTIANARIELAWECDYHREARCAQAYHRLLASPSDTTTFTVPRIYPDASGAQVLTADFMSGTAVTKIAPRLTQAQRDWIGTQILRLCLRELCDWAFMQTDPNWTNFLYNPSSQRLELLDFGAARAFPPAFVAPYIRNLRAAARRDRAAVRAASLDLGYLTPQDSRPMVDAHVSSVLTLAEPFADDAPPVYDFRDQTVTDRVRAFIPVMLRERRAPPPEETYSLHRKLSGAFLLLARLGSRVECRALFEESVGGWEVRGGRPLQEAEEIVGDLQMDA
jgi:aarF domain-containing kinase